MARHRSVARRDLPLELNTGDADLWPIAALLWVGSVALVALTIAHHRAFDVEATLASLCVLALPASFVRARRARNPSHTVRQ
jgi:hypothetical protein